MTIRAVRTARAAPKRSIDKKQVGTPSTQAPPPLPLPAQAVYQQWLEDVSNVNIGLKVHVGSPPEDASLLMQVSLSTLMSRVLQSRCRIDPSRLSVAVNDSDPQVFVSLSVTGRDEHMAEAIEGGLTPRKAFLRSAPHISQVATKMQECMRQVFGLEDFIVDVSNA